MTSQCHVHLLLDIYQYLVLLLLLPLLLLLLDTVQYLAPLMWLTYQHRVLLLLVLLL
jgi:hypothetical protein